MSTRIAKIWVLGLLAGLSVGVAQAAPSVDFSSLSGQLFNTEGPLSFGSTGADLAGATVTACFFNGNCYDQLWETTSDIGGKAEGEVEDNEWFLSLSGDSFSNAFFFDNFGPLGLMSFSVNTVGSNAFFDIQQTDGTATEGTDRGQPFALAGTWFDEGNFGLGTPVTAINVQYRNPLAINGNTTNGLYTFMQVNFSGGSDFTGFRGFFDFQSDTDFTPTAMTPIPEPNTLALFTAGLLIGFLTWRRQNPKA